MKDQKKKDIITSEKMAKSLEEYYEQLLSGGNLEPQEKTKATAQQGDWTKQNENKTKESLT